jgi:hypothetical protein
LAPKFFCSEPVAEPVPKVEARTRARTHARAHTRARTQVDAGGCHSLVGCTVTARDCAGTADVKVQP